MSLEHFEGDASFVSEVVDRLMGIYDANRFSTLLAEQQSDDVRMVTDDHEATHCHLGTCSTFGLLMTDVASGSVPLCLEDRGTALRHLFAICRETHESVATYWSLADARRRHLIGLMPDPYPRLFDRLAALADEVFPRRLLRVTFAIVLGRAAMNCGGRALGRGHDCGDLQSFLALLDPDDHPDRRYRLMVDHLLTIDPSQVRSELVREWAGPPDYVDQLMTADYYDDLYSRYGWDRKKADGAMDGLRVALMWGLGDLVESVVPGVMGAYVCFQLPLAERADEPLSMARYTGRAVGWVSALSVARQRSKERIVFARRLPFREDWNEFAPDKCAVLGRRSCSLLGVLYVFLRAQPGRDPAIYLIDSTIKEPWTVQACRVSPDELRLLQPPGTPIVAVIEEPDLTVDGFGVEALQSFVSRFPGMTAFSHVQRSGFELLEEAYLSDRRLTWAAFPFAYQLGWPQVDDRAFAVLYRFDGEDLVRFHMATRGLCDGLLGDYYTHFLRSPEAIRFSVDGILTAAPQEALNRLADHPAMRYYFEGGVPGDRA